MSHLYSAIDQSSLLKYLFYPRRQHTKARDGAFDLAIKVEENVSIICRAYPARSSEPWILYFHGNGEVVSDYDQIAPFYNTCGLNLLVADYRGYGASGGTPGFAFMIHDAAIIFEKAQELLAAENSSGRWVVMGRSLGSIPALELAARYSRNLQGLIIESGFISIVRLIRHLGLPEPGDLKPLEEAHHKLAGSIAIPSLIIHGVRDRLVPLTQGRELYENIGAMEKELVEISGADHNDIMFVEQTKYMDAISRFVTGGGC